MEQNHTQSQPIRIFAAFGPGDHVRAHGEAMSRRMVSTTSLTTSLTFSELLFNYCKVTANPILAISSYPRVDTIEDGIIVAENRRKSPLGAEVSGLAFHFLQFRWALYLAYRARRFRANVAFIDSGTTHYFALAIFRLIGVPVVVNLHNVLWPSGFPPTSLSGRIVRKLNALFFRRIASGGIGVSPECERQVLSEAQGTIPFFQYRCQYNRDGFRKAVGYCGGPFHVMFAGRVEANKGALDLVEISSLLTNNCPTPVVFHVCGDGSALAPLRDLIRQRRLEEIVLLHGHVGREDLLEIYSSCHAAIVPTRSTFPEGMPQVCAEAIIAGLPIVASKVTNALDLLGPAIAEAETDNAASYAERICQLVTEPAYYQSLRSATEDLSEQFFDRKFGYPTAVDRMLSTLFPNCRPLDDWSYVYGDQIVPINRTIQQIDVA
ncbi:glycosyltransferase family 4 protein [Frankia sp. RB7]|nr:glycosyltransferase family 4 protein [Frankia sp. RB7]